MTQPTITRTSRRLIFVLTIGLLFATAGCGGNASREEAGSAATVLAEGAFQNKGGQETAGHYRIVKREDGFELILTDDFETDRGPDLHVVLSPTPVSTVTGESAMNEPAEIVSILDTLRGKQVYPLRLDVSLDQFQSVLIHCVKFSHLYGAAPLQVRSTP